MNDLRAVIGIFIFCISSYLVYDLFSNGFDWAVLISAVAGYLSVHYIWPKNRDGDSAWYEVLEFIFDFPYQALAFVLRALIKPGKGDLDVDI